MRKFTKYSSCVVLLLFSTNGFAQKVEKKTEIAKSVKAAPAQQIVRPVLANIPAVANGDESLMSESPLTIDTGDWIEIKAYDASTKTYQIVTLDDPTPEKIYATPESVAKAIHSVNPDSMKADPKDIVGSRFNTDDGLVILFDFERDQRKTKNSGS